MTLGEKIEQRFTGRPDSLLPARVLQRLTGAAERPADQSRAANWTMHLGQGALIGVLRSVMAHAGLRGPVAWAMFAVVRLTNDQILENATGVGAPPQTWPRPELAVDLLHKSVFAAATGLVAEHWRPVPVRVPGSDMARGHPVGYPTSGRSPATPTTRRTAARDLPGYVGRRRRRDRVTARG